VSRGSNRDIRLNTSAPSHPKVKKLKYLLGELGDKGQRTWVWLLTFAGRERPGGVFDGMRDDDVELAGEWDGPPGKFIESALSVGLLDRRHDGTLELHDWSEHQPWASRADDRSLTASKNAHQRWCKLKLGEEDACHNPLCDSFTPPFARQKLQLLEISIAEWVAEREKKGAGPERNDFAAAFRAEFRMQWVEWEQLRSASEAYFNANREMAAAQ